MKVTLGVNEVITSLVLNQLAFMVVGLFRMYRVPEPVRPAVLASGTKLNSGVFLALAACIMLYAFMWLHQSGYEARMAGESFSFAHFAGIRSRSAIL